MRGPAIRTLCVAGAFVYLAGVAPASAAAPDTLDLKSYTTVVDNAAAPRARLAGQFDLGLPIRAASAVLRAAAGIPVGPV